MTDAVAEKKKNCLYGPENRYRLEQPRTDKTKKTKVRYRKRRTSKSPQRSNDRSFSISQEVPTTISSDLSNEEYEQLLHPNSNSNTMVYKESPYNQEKNEEINKMWHTMHSSVRSSTADEPNKKKKLGSLTRMRNAMERASTVDLTDQLSGALEIKLCTAYTVRIYVHYWLWQIPVLLVNIILGLIYHYSVDISLELGYFAVAPVFLCGLVRDKIFIWFVYWIIKQLQTFNCCSQYLRYHFSRLADCIGGLHSSCGVTALVWNIIYVIDLFDCEKGEFTFVSVSGLCLPILLCLISISALPCFRFFHHNFFECAHRYINWLGLCVLTYHCYLVNWHKAQNHDLFHILTSTPSIFVVGLIILTIYPWIIIHIIKGSHVEFELSQNNSCIVLIFPVWCPSGAVCRLSTNFVEFHVFGITPLPYDEEKGHRSLVMIKSLGDWTQSLIEKAQNGQLQNTLFWMHRIKSPNFSQGLFNWKRVFLLATGAGIAPLLPYVVKHYDGLELSLVWVARDHKNTYPKVLFEYLKHVKNVVLYDTTKRERRDLALYTVKMVQDFNAEAVFIVACPNIAYNVANYVHKKGIPVFASNFDV